MATLNRAYGDYRHVLRERPCLLGKTEDSPPADGQSERLRLGESPYVAFGWTCRLFDFHRVKDSVVFDKDVNFRTCLVAIEPEPRLLAPVPASLEQLPDDERFKHCAAHRAVRQRFGRRPSRKVAAQPCVGEIEFRRLDDPRRDVAGIRAEQIDEAGCAKDAEPVTGRSRGNARVSRKFGNIEQLPSPCGGGLEEHEETLFVCDASEVVDVPFEVGAYVGTEERLPVPRPAGDNRREGTAVDAGEDGRERVEGCLGIYGVWGEKRIIGCPSKLFSLSDSSKVDYADSSGKRFAYVTHQMELLGAGEPESSASIAIAVDCHLDERKKLRGVLDFVDDDGWRIGLKKERWFASRKGAKVGIVERHEFAPVLGGIAQKRCLANLSCATDHYGRELVGKFSDSG